MLFLPLKKWLNEIDMKAPDHKATICGLIYNLFITSNLYRIYTPGDLSSVYNQVQTCAA